MPFQETIGCQLEARGRGVHECMRYIKAGKTERGCEICGVDALKPASEDRQSRKISALATIIYPKQKYRGV